MVGQPVLFAGIGVLCGAAFVVGRNLVQRRRQRRRRLRRDQLRNLGKRQGLELLGRHLPEEVLENAALFRGRRHKVQVDDVLRGQDESGRYRLGRRHLAGIEHHYLEFETRFDGGLDGLHLEPLVQSTVLVPRWRRLLRRYEEIGERARFRLEWVTRPSLLRDEDAMQTLQRFARTVAKKSEGADALPLGLEVGEGCVVVHATRILEGPALSEFLRRALGLRTQVMGEIQRRHSHRVATATMTAQQLETKKEGEVDTRPLFPVRGTEKLADAGPETVSLSAEDLLRELPDPRPQTRRPRKGGKSKGFEIPEPEEEVVLIRAR